MLYILGIVIMLCACYFSLMTNSPLPLLPPSSISDIQCAAQSSLDMLEQQIYSMSSFSGVHRESDAFTSQLVNCHAVLSDSELCARVNTVPAYLDVNRMVSMWSKHVEIIARNFVSRERLISCDCGTNQSTRIEGVHHTSNSMPPLYLSFWNLQSTSSA